MWWRVMALAGAYVVVGQLSLLLAIPPGYAAALWPAAGMAVAALLVFGSRLWPGVMLGSFLVNVGTRFEMSTAWNLAQSLALPSAIGAGAALQAVAGAWLARRF